MYGEMVNNTGSSQELTLVSGAFYDAQGQLIAGEESIIDYWPVDIIPPGGRLPFELTVLEIENAANFDLSVQSQPSGQTPHQNFEFSDLDQPRLDASIFLDKGIPSVSFSVYGAPTYPYTTKDTVRTVNPEVMGDLARILYRSILGMANANKDFFKDR